GRPGLLTTLCVLCLVLGALGLMNSLMGAAGAVGGQKLQAMLQPKASPSMPPEMQQAQQEFQDQVNAVQGRYFWQIVGGLAFRLIASVLLLVGGIRSLGVEGAGRETLLIACAVAVVFELAHSILQSLVNMDMMTAVNSFVEKMTTSMPQQNNAPPGMGNLLQGIIRG